MTKKRVALVTGASSGIGEASARKLLAAGYRVYGTSRRGAQAGKHSFPLLTLDVTDDASVGTAIDELLRLEGRIDVLVNNAGFGVAPAAAEESSIEQARHIFDTNFLGIVRLSRAVIPHMRRQGSDPSHAPSGQWAHHQYRFDSRDRSVAVCGTLCSQ